MRILFDQGAPWPLRNYLTQHQSVHAFAQGWDRIQNGDLLTAAEAAGFDLLLTTDKNVRYQQNLRGRKIAIIVLSNGQWPDLRPHIQLVVDAVNKAKPGSYVEVEVPR